MVIWYVVTLATDQWNRMQSLKKKITYYIWFLTKGTTLSIINGLFKITERESLIWRMAHPIKAFASQPWGPGFYSLLKVVLWIHAYTLSCEHRNTHKKKFFLNQLQEIHKCKEAFRRQRKRIFQQDSFLNRLLQVLVIK